jgi:putative ABC transport system permease protein
MAWRETRTSWARLVFFFVCVAVGVGAIVTIRSVVQHIRTSLVGEARQLVGADLVVRTRAVWRPEVRAGVEAVLDRPSVTRRIEMVETQTMVAAPEGLGTGVVRLVELRAVEAGFPFYGSLELGGGEVYRHGLLVGRGLLAQPELLVELGLEVGDPVRLAGELFTIRGVVIRDRVRREGLAFGPMAYIDLADLRRTSLLGAGSRATYAILAQVEPEALDEVSREIRRRYRREGVSTRSWRSLEDQLGRNLTIAENHLSLVGFAVLVLGGIGVWSVTRVLVQQKLKSVAILKCLGATSGQVLGTYLLQVAWLAVGGGVLGLGLAVLAVSLIPISVVDPLGVTGLGVTASAAFQGLAVGLLVSVLFAVVPLLEVRHVKPLLLLRADTLGSARRRDWTSVLVGVATTQALVLVAIWQAGSLESGLFVSVGLVTMGVGLLMAGRGLVWAVSPLARSSRFALRHAVVSLGRPGNQTRLILLAVGLGCFFILAVLLVQANLVSEFELQLGGNSPDLVLIDIQPDQVDGVSAVVAPFVRTPPTLLPLLRARVDGIEGRTVHLPTREALRREGTLTREYGITFRSALEDNERVEAGEFWSGPLTTPAPDGVDTEVSIEQDVHERSGVELGDLMRFDVSGQVLTARVTSVRSVGWSTIQNGGFVFVFRPGPAVARVAHTYVGFLDVADDPTARGMLQRELVRAYPNVSAIDVREVLLSLQEIIDTVTRGVTIVGGVTVVSGVLILIGAVALTKFQRLYEAAIYRTLGASTKLIATMVAIEYTMLGVSAGVLGAVGAGVLSWALAEAVFEIAWQPAIGVLLAGVAVTALAVGAVGVAASADVLVRKPLATLRRQ